VVDLELYRIFKVVAEEENITNASKKLNISQPAVTKHIQNLESILQLKLFERTNKGLVLTEVGKEIYEDINESIEILTGVFNKYDDNKNINLGIHATMLSKMFSHKLAEFYAENEDIKINIVNYDASEMLAKLEKKELDIVVSKKLIGYDNKKIKFVKLGELHDILVTKNLTNKKISLTELKKKLLYMPRRNSVTTINFFDSTKTKEKDFKNIKNISYNTMLEFIKKTDSIGLVTKEYIEEELRAKNVIEIAHEFVINPIEYGIYTSKDKKMEALKLLINKISK
jgi:DNA-binding transcriptional LysR family regulator